MHRSHSRFVMIAVALAVVLGLVPNGQSVQRSAAQAMAPIRPILECVVANRNGSFTAHFGYKNDNAGAVTIPIGASNKFTPAPANRGQPTTFQPGRTAGYPTSAFRVDFDGSNLVWTLNGRTSTASRSSTRCSAPPDTQAPGAPPNLRMVDKTASSVTLTWDAATDNVAVTGYQVYNGTTLAGSTAERSFTVSNLSRGPTYTFTARARDAAGNVSPPSNAVEVRLGSPLPDDPAVVAPPLDRSVATDIAAATAFLYSGTNPIQTGVAGGTIDARRVVVLRGAVRARDGSPLSGVTITVNNHPEYGQTLTREDGAFDLAANGGGLLTISYQRDGYLPIQRQIDAPWRDYAWLPDVVMIPLDSQVTPVNLAAGAPLQVARGSVVTDADGARQATLLFPEGTRAEVVRAVGTTQPASTLHIRATEYTVGPTGPQAMPGDLPPTSGYTYAVELSADEAVAKVAGKDVLFNQPVYFYLDNFLQFPAGTTVPMGYYDKGKGIWIPSDSGRVVKVIGVTAGLASLDVTGNGQAADAAALAALGFSDAERRQLGTLYSVGTSVWRVPLDHLSTWDANWGTRCKDDDCDPPGQPEPSPTDVQGCSDTTQGSIIECQSQVLGEVVGVTGTDFSLHYTTRRVPDRKAEYSLEIPLTGAQPPRLLKAISLHITVAGRSFAQRFAATANQRVAFIWDGKDAYGRALQGKQSVTVALGYVYDMEYVPTTRFGYAGQAEAPIVADRARNDFSLVQVWKGLIGGWDARVQGLGGWTLSDHHAYDPGGKIVHSGDGTQRSAESIGRIIETVAGSSMGVYPGDGRPATEVALINPRGPAIGPDGSLYFGDSGRVRKVTPDGIMTTVAGTGSLGYSGDGGPATQAQLQYPQDVALGPDGSVYFSDNANHRVRRIGPDGVMTTVAGTGAPVFGGDGGPAVNAHIRFPEGLAVASDGSLYIADAGNAAVRRIDPTGTISTVAGIPGGGYEFNGDDIPARQARLHPTDVAIGPDGSLYIADALNYRVRRVGFDGMITTVAGRGRSITCRNTDPCGDGGPATAAQLYRPWSIAVGADGSLYIAQDEAGRIRVVTPDGFITTAVGSGAIGFTGDGGPAPRATLYRPLGLATTPDGSLYLADMQNNRIRRVQPVLPGVSLANLLIPAADGGEAYLFDGRGRHLRTYDALTGALRYQFAYDAAGRLASATDGDTNVTTIERDVSGNVSAIVGPYGQRTTLMVNSNDYVSRITNPAGEKVDLEYTAAGLLTKLIDPKRGMHEFSYDALGRLSRDDDPADGTKTLSRNQGLRAFSVAVGTAENRTTTYQVERTASGDERRVTTGPDGLKTESVRSANATQTYRAPDGTSARLAEGPDPRWGMQAPLASSANTTTPGGLNANITTQRTATVAEAGNLLSLTAQTATVTVNGRPYTTTYSAANKSITEMTPAGRQTVATLDTKGRIVGVQVPDLAAASYAYDSRGRLTTVTWGAGAEARTTTLAYDSAGYLASITNPMERMTSFTYDQAGRVVAQKQPDGQTISYAYDANGNLTGVTPPGRPTHTFSHTPVDLTASYAPPSVGTEPSQTTYTYNRDRQPTRSTRPDGKTVQRSYDSAGRPDALITDRGTTDVSYDAATGNLSTLGSPDGVGLSYAHDGALVKAETWSGPVDGSIGYTYDNNFQVISISVNGGSTVTLQYDRDGLLTKAGALTLNRNTQNGLLSGSTLGTVSDAWTYNAFGEPTTYTAAHDGASLYTVQYKRDKLGRITEKTELIGGATDTYAYAYDVAGRLTTVTKNGDPIERYTYDANGNRLSFSASDSTITGTYDSQDRLTKYGNATYSYSTNGELQSKTVDGETTTYDHDVLGNLRNVTLPDGRELSYVIDGRNRRIGKKVNGTLVKGLLYDGQLRLVAELAGNGNIISRFVYATHFNVPDYMIKGGVTYRIITDQLGSPRFVINTSTGEAVQRMGYDAFGAVVEDTNPGLQPFGFAGGLYDLDTKLVRFGARDYDAETGHWMAKDPIGFAGGDTNLYGYVENDPVNYIDPDGLGKELPGPGNTTYRIDMNQQPRPNMHIKHPGGETIVNHKGGFDPKHGGKDTAKLPKWLRKEYRPIIRQFIKKACEQLKGSAGSIRGFTPWIWIKIPEPDPYYNGPV